MSYMYSHRRFGKRILVDTMCNELVAERSLLGRVLDVSENGLRIQRLLKRRNPDRVVQLEFELPDSGEVIWAKGEICFDQLWPVEVAGRPTPVRTSGIRLVAAAQKHLRLLREFVMEVPILLSPPDPSPPQDDAWMWRSAHFLRA